jgi:hypothetical protein
MTSQRQLPDSTFIVDHPTQRSVVPVAGEA